MRKTTWGVCLLGIAGALSAPAPLAAADDGDPPPSAEAAAGQAQKLPGGAVVWVKGPFGDLYPLGGWRNCNEAKMSGHFPVLRGELGYNPALDPDNTGVECT